MRHESASDRDTIIRLQIAGDDLRFSVLENSGAGEARSVSVGSITPIRSILRHEPVTAPELEAAIAEVEDLIMPVIRTLPYGYILEVAGRELCEAAEALPSSGVKPVPIEDVERLFNRLANVATGSPVGSQGVPVTTSFALGLVVLREVMHHGGYHSVLRG